jgi:NAD(P)-dependent dehydrogenase (short-subunit alcohol dehydrogenase family)
MPKSLKNFKTVITGGTGAMGQEVVSAFVKEGATVFTNYRSEDKLTQLKSSVAEKENLQGKKADLTDEEQVKNFFGDYETKFRRLDVFIHIMGGFWMGKEVVDTSLKEWHSMMNINLNSAFLCAREAFRMMKAQCSGKIITVSAKTVEEFPPEMGAYVVSKSALIALSQVLANEGKAYNILVNSILPSIIDTPANREAMPDADYSKWVTPKDIAQFLIQVCQPEVKILSQSKLKIYNKM